MDDFAVFLTVFPTATIEAVATALLQIVEELGLFLFRAKVEDGHFLELVRRIPVHLDSRLIHFQKAQRFSIDHPRRKRVVAEQQPEHFFFLAQGVFRAAPLDCQGYVAPNRTHELEIPLTVCIPILVMLRDEHADRSPWGRGWHPKPRW